MRNIMVLLFIAMMSMKNCDKNNRLTQEQEQQLLDKMYTEIQVLAGSKACTDATDWAFTAIGAKACGGPTGYIAYSLELDTGSFLEKVEQYTSKQADFNKKWGVVSDCSVPPAPTGVECVDGAPKLIY